ncbi:MAG: sodium/solute symporter [Proteobacteria bacterium]|nr:sodium/solute symporter [Pseudomonadota bacterium]
MTGFAYQYLVGGLVFAIGLVYGYRQGYIGTSGKPLRNALVVLGGFGFFMGLQGWLQFGDMAVREPKPFDGSWTRSETIGTPLDYAIMAGYFVAMLLIGTWFGKDNKGTKDFFFGGQRFSWWLISFSLVATTVGSASFVKYSRIAYKHGIASSQTYLNDWFWLPLLLFGWLPILYFSRIVSIPEYFERRFGRGQRNLATWLLLAYLVGYVGINLFTMGRALNTLLGWPVFASALLVASISAIYVTFGGQTSVIMTDLFQGVMLLATGLVLLLLGVAHLGGFIDFWELLPRGHRQAFPHLNADPSYPAVGVFWQDGMANSAMFYFLNQGIVMRLLAARSVEDSRKATVSMMLVLMPIAAVVVASGGWVARALVSNGELPPDLVPKESFFIAAEFLTRPGMFGLVMAALTAALMSTVDTLITAIAAIAVNDVYKPRHPEATDKQLLKVARISSVSIAVLGVALVPVFNTFKSIYSAHGAFTAAVTPPLVVALLLAVFWRRYTATAATWTMAGGSLLIGASLFFPQMITPFAHGVPMRELGEGIFGGVDSYKFMRAFFGLAVCFAIGITVTMFTKARPLDEVKGLVWGTVKDAIHWYKGAPGEEVESPWADASAASTDDEELRGRGRLPTVTLSRALADALGGAVVGDLVYVTDARSWLGGLRSGHGIVGAIDEDEGAPRVTLGPTLWSVIVGHAKPRPLRVRKLY